MVKKKPISFVIMFLQEFDLLSLQLATYLFKYAVLLNNDHIRAPTSTEKKPTTTHHACPLGRT